MNNEKGNIALLLLFAMTLIIGMTAMVVDIGYLMLEKQKLSDALDAAALAGAQDLMADPLKAKDIAIQYGQANGITNPEVVVDTANKEITVNGQKNVNFYFAKAFGYNQTTINAASKAGVKPISSGTGLAPIGVVQQSFEYGQFYSLKSGASDGINGNFGALALGGTGASTYRDNLKYGYQGNLAIGMKVPTETGNMSGPTKTAIDYRLDSDAGTYGCDSYLTATRKCNRVLFVPVIDSLDLNGSGEVTIVGFAAFYLEGISGNGVDSYIDGRFLKMVFPGEWDDSGNNDYGLYAVKLVY